MSTLGILACAAIALVLDVNAVIAVMKAWYRTHLKDRND